MRPEGIQGRADTHLREKAQKDALLCLPSQLPKVSCSLVVGRGEKAVVGVEMGLLTTL